MTYRDLKRWLNKFSEDELDLDITIYAVEMDEFFPVRKLSKGIPEAENILDEGHPVIEALI